MSEPIIANLEDVWRDIADLCDGLSAEQWSAATECPGWTVHDQVAHMIGTERMLMGERADAAASDAAPSEGAHVRNDIGKANEQWVASYRAWDTGKLLDEFRAVTGRRLEQLRALTQDDWNREGFTPEGPGPYRLFMAIRVFDCWYHDQDIREAVNRPGFLDGPASELSLRRIVDKGLPYVVGKKAGAPQGSCVRFEVDPPAWTVDIVVEGRAAVAPVDPQRPATASLLLDRRTFSRLAGGRWSGDHARTHGALRVDGDVDLANRVVDNMAFTI